MEKENTIILPTGNEALDFPDSESKERFTRYHKFDRLQDGRQFEAFNITLEGDLFKRWGHLRYVVAPFAGLISKVMADMLFGEPVRFNCRNDDTQEFLNALAFNNRLHVQNYESAFANSGRGDAVYKIRIGKRYPTDDHSSIIIEDISPYIYFPSLNEMNMRGIPQEETLAWIIKQGQKQYVRKEIHSAGTIRNEIWEYNDEKEELGARLSWRSMFPGEPEVVNTKIKKNLIVHVPNWRMRGTNFFGTSDYYDLEPLFFALNNRLTKIDNILDKHSDPILAVPEGVIDEDGHVKKEAIGYFEMPPGDQSVQKPEYIVWNANLEAAFTQIDKLTEMLFMFSETSPDILGMGKGQSDSGRALKFKLLRTIAKKQRKQLYYDQALKEIMTISQELAYNWGLYEYMDGEEIKFPSEIETPEIEFGEGIVKDTFEAAQEEQIRISSGTTSVKDSIMRLDGVDEETAEKKVKEINEESGMNLPLTDEKSMQNMDEADMMDQKADEATPKAPNQIAQAKKE